MVDLWESIFTPGPTSTLIQAANVSFAALQLVLLALLIGTHSVHFVVLSVLCAGLWWSINWFAAELKIAQQKEKEEEARKAAEEGSDTEVEGLPEGGKKSSKEKKKDDLGEKTVETLPVEPVEKKGELRQRGEVMGTQSSVSTEDEWEKVSEEENETGKDK